MKKGWMKPKLVVLVRGSTEESVLSACKSPQTSGSVDTFYNSCTDVGCSKCNDHLES
jgi:hypothetical protein